LGVDGSVGANAMEVVAGDYHTCARLSGNTARCWGQNDHGQLGDGTTTGRLLPVAPRGLSDVAELAAGFYHSCARHEDGSIHCWGYNGSGQLGDGTLTDRSTPVGVRGLPWLGARLS
jgi:alpha-tubulin suppressor-like RCC1 family protein